MAAYDRYPMTTQKAEAILKAWNAGLYIEWWDTDKAGYSLSPKRLIVGHCDDRCRIIGRGYDVISVSIDESLVITTDRVVFIFPIRYDRQKGVEE